MRVSQASHQQAVHNDINAAQSRWQGVTKGRRCGKVVCWTGTGACNSWLACLEAESPQIVHGSTTLCAHRRMGEVKCVYSGAARP